MDTTPGTSDTDDPAAGLHPHGAPRPVAGTGADNGPGTPSRNSACTGAAADRCAGSARAAARAPPVIGDDAGADPQPTCVDGIRPAYPRSVPHTGLRPAAGAHGIDTRGDPGTRDARPRGCGGAAGPPRAARANRGGAAARAARVRRRG